MKGPGPLIPGLEESSGALYEIGVSDDGTFVGLARDELEESLNILRTMAFSLGCNIKVIRMIIVGDCQWIEQFAARTNPLNRLRKEKLWVAEVLVAPNLDSQDVLRDMAALPVDSNVPNDARELIGDSGADAVELHSDQLRVSLTGGTTSGKSSLLGTLSTSTLDNGRGKSRLSLLKHRHEIVSGMTSSLAQELFAYQSAASPMGLTSSKVINYASGNVSSWDDIHNASDLGRLVFVTDSAGHPRYRRTTVRGLVSWAPHWILCCIAADDQDDSSGKVGATASSSEILGSAGVGVDLSKAHLNLCLKLSLPLVIVITKLDLATKTGLRDTLAKILTMLKSAGRKPVVLSSSVTETRFAHIQSIIEDDEAIVRGAIDSVQPSEVQALVPIVLTSAVTGAGIGRLHALLRQLPVRVREAAPVSVLPPQGEPRPPILFHVDEVFVMPLNARNSNAKANAPSTILSGYLRYGTLDVGESVLIGPCPPDGIMELGNDPRLQCARSYPGLIKGSPKVATLPYEFLGPSSGDTPVRVEKPGKSTSVAQTWQKVRIASLRNLRLPVRRLFAGQVGTVGIALSDNELFSSIGFQAQDLSIRRGMVLLPLPKNPQEGPPPSYNRFSAAFQEAGLPAWPGVLVIVYIASIRASAKIIEVRALETETAVDEVFRFDDNEGNDSGIATSGSSLDNQQTEITFEFANTHEWFEIGSQVLVTPGGGPSLTGQPEQREAGSAGLDGYVGKIVQASVC